MVAQGFCDHCDSCYREPLVMLMPAKHALFYAQNSCAASFCQLKSRYLTLLLKHRQCSCSRPPTRTVTDSHGVHRAFPTLLSRVGSRSRLVTATAQRPICTNDQSRCLSVTQRAQAEQYLQLVLHQNVTLNLTGSMKLIMLQVSYRCDDMYLYCRRRQHSRCTYGTP